jgi:hypothetical protein
MPTGYGVPFESAEDRAFRETYSQGDFRFAAWAAAARKGLKAGEPVARGGVRMPPAINQAALLAAKQRAGIGATSNRGVATSAEGQVDEDETRPYSTYGIYHWFVIAYWAFNAWLVAEVVLVWLEAFGQKIFEPNQWLIIRAVDLAWTGFLFVVFCIIQLMFGCGVQAIEKHMTKIRQEAGRRLTLYMFVQFIPQLIMYIIVHRIRFLFNQQNGSQDDSRFASIGVPTLSEHIVVYFTWWWFVTLFTVYWIFSWYIWFNNIITLHNHKLLMTKKDK